MLGWISEWVADVAGAVEDEVVADRPIGGHYGHSLHLELSWKYIKGGSPIAHRDNLIAKARDLRLAPVDTGDTPKEI